MIQPGTITLATNARKTEEITLQQITLRTKAGTNSNQKCDVPQAFRLRLRNPALKFIRNSFPPGETCCFRAFYHQEHFYKHTNERKWKYKTCLLSEAEVRHQDGRRDSHTRGGGALHMHKLASCWTVLYPGHGFRKRIMGCGNEDRLLSLQKMHDKKWMDRFRGFAHSFWHMTVWLLLPLLLFQRCNKFDPHLHSNLFTDKTQQKKKQEEQAWNWPVLEATTVTYRQIYIISSFMVL